MLAGILGRISGWKTAYDKQGTALAEALAKTETAESNLKTLDEPYRRLKVAHDDLAVRLSTAIGDRNAAVKSRNEARTERDEAFQQISDAIPEFPVLEEEDTGHEQNGTSEDSAEVVPPVSTAGQPAGELVPGPATMDAIVQPPATDSAPSPAPTTTPAV